MGSGKAGVYGGTFGFRSYLGRDRGQSSELQAGRQSICHLLHRSDVNKYDFYALRILLVPA